MLARLASARRISASHSPRSGGGRLDAEVVEHEVVDALAAEDERDLVDVVDVARGDDRLDRQRREQRDLLADVAWRAPPSERHMSMSGWMPMRRSSLTECCVGLVLSSPAWPMYGTSVRWMNMQRVAADVDRELADRLEERQRLDVADRAADLGDDDVDVLASRRSA